MAESKPIFDLLAKAQSEMTNPKMRGEGQIGSRKYSYAELSDVLNVVRKALNDNGLYLLQKTVREDDGTLYISTNVCRGDEVVELDREYYSYETDPQNFGKRETYARRYSLNKAFGLAGENDSDGDTGPVKEPKKSTWQTLGGTKKPSKRQQMLAKVARYKAVCIEHGLTNEELDGYLEAHFQTNAPAKLTDEQLIEYGKQLAETVKKYEEEK